MSDLERNKMNVTEFYELMFNKGKPRVAIERFAARWFTQHSPAIADGPEAFIRFYENLAEQYPTKRAEFKRIMAEGDYVVLHSHHKWPGGHEFACVDIFRMDSAGMIIEHWDVMQRVPEKPANTNSMF